MFTAGPRRPSQARRLQVLRHCRVLRLASSLLPVRELLFLSTETGVGRPLPLTWMTQGVDSGGSGSQVPPQPQPGLSSSLWFLSRVPYNCILVMPVLLSVAWTCATFAAVLQVILMPPAPRQGVS